MNEDGREQVDNTLKIFLLLELNDFRSDAEGLSQSACNTVFPTIINKGNLGPKQAYA